MIKKITKHLYIHIPFCNSICTYCDFVRYIKSKDIMRAYINKIIKEIKHKYKFKQFQTIYIGGGTPNALPNNLLKKLLCTLSKYLDKHYEFTIECNPEHLNLEQAKILKQNKVNRVSIGLQTIKSTLLHKLNRKHTLADVTNAIGYLRKVGIRNISVDLLYGLNELSSNDILKTIQYLHHMRIPHVSWYALELKPNSKLTKEGYRLHDSCVDKHLKSIIKLMSPYKRYEVSNWTLHKKYESLHNKAYWTTQDWAAIGLGSCGFENMIYYENKGNWIKWDRCETKYSMHDYYFQIMLMGLRLKEGIDLSIKSNKQAYKYFLGKLKYVHTNKNHLIVDDLNLIDNTLINLV